MVPAPGTTAARANPIDWNHVDDWDSDNHVAKLTAAPGASITSLPEQDTHIVFEPALRDGLPLRMLFEPANSETLVISLHGAMNRGRFRIPRFEWRRTLNRLDSARLYLSDSTLEINGSLEIGWYIGTEGQDLIADYAAVVNQIIAAGGYSRVVCVGSSAGGYGALALSRRIPNSVAVAFSPQTTIGGYHLAQRKALASAAFPGTRPMSRSRTISEPESICANCTKNCARLILCILFKTPVTSFILRPIMCRSPWRTASIRTRAASTRDGE